VSNAADLIALCSIPADDPHYSNALGFCHGYLTGSYHFYDSTEPVSSRLICSPQPTPRRADVMSAFVAWGRRHPEHMKDRAVDALFRFLAETYPCKKPR